MSQTTTKGRVTGAVDARVYGDEGPIATITTELSYDAADPFALTMDFRVLPATQRWVFARDLLIDGIYRPTGRGDVHVFPCIDRDGSAAVGVLLLSVAGRAYLRLDTRTVASFVCRMLDLVPRGGESALVDLDEAVLEAVRARG